MNINRKQYLMLTGVVAAAGLTALTPIGTVTLKTAGATGTDLLALMKARSPGERMAGAETSKQAKLAPIAAALPASSPPVSRVLSSAAPAAAVIPAVVAPAAPLAAASPAAVLPIAPIVAAPLVAAPVAAAGIPAGVGALGLLPLAAVGSGGSGGGLAVTPPGGGAAPPPTGGTPPPTGGGETPPPAPAVPEPATWLMMITGFGLLGTALRRRRKLARAVRPLRSTVAG